jgi:transcriptional regulator with XRE-family HTH domain
LAKRFKLAYEKIAIVADIQASNYSTIHSKQRDISIGAMDKIVQFFGMAVDDLIHFEGNIRKDVTIEDKTVSERVRMIEQLEEEDKQALYRIIDGMLTKYKFKDFFNKNLAAL